MILDTILGVGLLIVLCGWVDTAFELRAMKAKLDAALGFSEFDIDPEDQA